jgi:hypothetical protein
VRTCAADYHRQADGLASKQTLRQIEELTHRLMDQAALIEVAKQLNTYKKHDRSPQYQDATLRGLLRDINGIAKAHREFKEKVVATALSGAGALILFLGGELIKCLK